MPATLRQRYRSTAFTVLHAARRTSARWRIGPDFVVIGAQKSGTSSLAARVFAHPQVLPPLRREVHYFDLDHRRDLGWYHAHFATARHRDRVARRHGMAITGEASPYYLFHPRVPERMHAVLPDVRLITILREPVDRAVSEYHHAVRFGFETRPIEIALDCTRPMIDEVGLDVAAWDDPDGQARRHSYVERGHYATQLDRWFDAFPRERHLVLTTGHLQDHRALAQVERFLGLEPQPRPELVNRNVHAHDHAPAHVLDELAAHYEPHNERLVALLGSLPWAAGDDESSPPTDRITPSDGPAAP